MNDHHPPPPPDEIPATAGAQRQIDAIDHRLSRGLRAMIIAGALFILGLGFTYWQITKAFDKVEAERLARIGGQSSINAYFCRKIDDVGKGVAALVTVSLEQSPPPNELPEEQRRAYEQFASYADRQERPPRCKQVAEQLAILTGADPEDVQITPLRLHGHPIPEGKDK